MAEKKQKTDWLAVEAEYVEGSDDITAVVLAEKHGVATDTVARHLARGKWRAKREDLRREAAKLARQKGAEERGVLHAEQAGVRTAKLHELFLIFADKAAQADKGPESVSWMTSLGIACDKLRMEQEKHAGGSYFEEEHHSRRRVLIDSLTGHN